MVSDHDRILTSVATSGLTWTVWELQSYGSWLQIIRGVIIVAYHRLQLSTPKRLEDIHLRTSKPSTAHAPLVGLPGAKRPQNTGSPTKWSYYEAIICRDVGQWHFLVTLNQSQGTPLCQRLLVSGHGNPTMSTRWLTFIVLAPCPVSNWDCHLKQWKEITFVQYSIYVVFAGNIPTLCCFKLHL